MRILVTGASGFLGSNLVPHLIARGHFVRAASRYQIPTSENLQHIAVSDLREPTDWFSAVKDTDVVIHAAGVAHRSATEEECRSVNFLPSLSLANAAHKAAVKQFIYISSVSAQIGSFSEHPLSEHDSPTPSGPYGRYKLAVEQELSRMNLPVTILRPAVVFGPNAKGNFRSLKKLASLPLPLPLGALDAQRSILSIENLNSAIDTVLGNEKSLGEIYIVSNPQPKTVPQMIAEIRRSNNRQPGIFKIPLRFIEPPLKAAGVWERIGLPLVVRPDKLINLGWSPREYALSY